MVFYKSDEIIEKLFEKFLYRYPTGLETSMRGRNFVFDSVCFLLYKCHEINIKRGGSYVDSPEWIKKKKQQ